MAVKTIQPKKPGVSAKAKGSKAIVKATGRKTLGGRYPRKTMSLSQRRKTTRKLARKANSFRGG